MTTPYDHQIYQSKLTLAYASLKGDVTEYNVSMTTPNDLEIYQPKLTLTHAWLEGEIIEHSVSMPTYIFNSIDLWTCLTWRWSYQAQCNHGHPNWARNSSDSTDLDTCRTWRWSHRAQCIHDPPESSGRRWSDRCRWCSRKSDPPGRWSPGCWRCSAATCLWHCEKIAGMATHKTSAHGHNLTIWSDYK